MTNDDKKRLCSGCQDDHYNQPGNSTTGECWSLASARVVERTKVGWWQNGPYEWKPQTTLHCHNAPGQFAWIDSSDVRLRKESVAAVAPQ